MSTEKWRSYQRELGAPIERLHINRVPMEMPQPWQQRQLLYRRIRVFRAAQFVALLLLAAAATLMLVRR